MVSTDSNERGIRLLREIKYDCYPTPEEFARDLVDNLVFIDDSNLKIVIGPSTPGTESRGALWIATDRSNQVLGLRFYSPNEKWLPIGATGVSDQLIKVIGRSDNPPYGYETIDFGVSGFSEDVVLKLKQEYVPLGESSDIYEVFYVRKIKG